MNRQELQKKVHHTVHQLIWEKGYASPLDFLEDGEALSKTCRGMAIRKGALSGAGPLWESGSIQLYHERIQENGGGDGS